MKTTEELLENAAALCAKVAHEVNRAYCRTIGDTSQPAWEDAPEWQRASAITGANAALKNPDQTPEKSHEGWSEQKRADGWRYGPTKDPEQKFHPCLLPYAELPPEQRAKDELFLAAVRGTHAALKTFMGESLADLLEAAAADLRKHPLT